MISVLRDFQTRVLEVEAYFQFVEALDSKQALVKSAASGSNFMPDAEFDSLLKTLKANGFIILYNLVESTMKNAIEAVFDEFRAQNVEFDRFREEVRRIVIRNLKSHNPDGVAERLVPIAQRIITETFRKEKEFSGNVDAKKIREVAANYGFVAPRARGDDLLTVKSNRNDLAHGDKAFAEVGRDFDIQRLVQIKDAVRVYLAELLQHVGTYLTTQAYLIV